MPYECFYFILCLFVSLALHIFNDIVIRGVYYYESHNIMGCEYCSSPISPSTEVLSFRPAKLPMKLEWMEGYVRVIFWPEPAFRYDKVKKHKIWFNDVVGGFKDQLNDYPSKGVIFSDGKPLSTDVSEITVLRSLMKRVLYYNGERVMFCC
ncbi:hypothetical protein L1987_37820 [Smallanthus sonchifolius]|uniref:Uncharacterized protein n=1 Tax=Smallanthus sonchifolius TaxID=185202 RepID=A0ACB9HI46_9ASTR|nr:hypothetical protein L1987_37820 [Smallanthus sonchifolius]